MKIWKEDDPHDTDCASRIIPSAECTCGKTDYLAELEQCPACGGDGILFVAVDGNEAPPTMRFVQRCDTCNRYEDDFEAAANCARPILAVLVREQ